MPGNIPFIDIIKISSFFESLKSKSYTTYFIIMFILLQMGIIFFQFPSKRLGRNIHGLCFSWLNDSLIRSILKPIKIKTRGYKEEIL